MTVATADRKTLLKKFDVDPVLLNRPVVGAPKTIKVNGKNATEHADALGDIKRQIKELEETEKKYTDAFKAYVRERIAKALEKDPNTIPSKSLLITGVVYRVDVKIDLESDRFEVKRFTDENPGIAALYTKPSYCDKVDVRNVK